MAEYQGYLLKFGSAVFPMKYIKSESYVSTDNQRTELKAYRNADNYLVRQTSPNYKTKIEFETPPLLLSEYKEISSIIAIGTVNARERKVRVTYWSTESLRYQKAYMYITDTDYTIKNSFGKELLYNPIKITSIEY